MELRVNTANMEASEDGALTVSGYVNLTEQPSKTLGREQKFREIITRGAWQRAIDRAGEVHFYAEHDKNKILASTRNNSLQLREDENGLYMSATISPTTWGKDYYQLIKDGILQNMSFGFRALKDSWRNLGDHFERTVNELELFEVSVVRDPAYASSSISARGIDLVEDEVPDSEINVRSIEIRSDEDIEAIARKIYEMLQANVKPTEEKLKDEQETKEDDTQSETTTTVEENEEDQTVEETVETQVEKTETEVETEDDEVETEEQTKDEEIEEEENSHVETVEKLREFIKQHKQEE